jgi:hypothetical protein
MSTRFTSLPCVAAVLDRIAVEQLARTRAAPAGPAQWLETLRLAQIQAAVAEVVDARLAASWNSAAANSRRRAEHLYAESTTPPWAAA